MYFCIAETVSRLVSEKPDNTITPSPSSPSLSHHNVTSQCRGIDYPDGGMIVGDLPNEIYDVGHVLGFACFVKYKIVGPKEVTCQANGTWSPSPPSCKSKHVVFCYRILQRPYQDFVSSTLIRQHFSSTPFRDSQKHSRLLLFFITPSVNEMFDLSQLVTTLISDWCFLASFSASSLINLSFFGLLPP